MSLQLFNYSVKISALNTPDYRVVKCFNTIQAFIKLKTGVNFRIRNCLKVSTVRNNYKTLKFISPTNAPLYYTYKMLKYLMIAPTCFGPPGPSSGSLCRTLLKLQFFGDSQ